MIERCDVRTLSGGGLAGEPGLGNPEGGKPKGMHWRTFQRQRAEYHAYANASWAGMAERLVLVNRRLDKLRLNPLDDLGRNR
jgi:hypothetical protein